MPTRLLPKWLDTTGYELGKVLIANGLNGTIVSDITVHEHTNFDLLEAYTQTEEDLSNAVSNTHSHTNSVLLDSYSQTEVDLASAVTLKHYRNQDIGTTNDKFTLYSATHPVSMKVINTEDNKLLVFYNEALDAHATLRCGDLIFTNMYHIGPNLGFFDTTPVAKTSVTLTNTDNEIGGLTFNATTYTGSEIEALRDKCEALADDVRALHAALASYGLI